MKARTDGDGGENFNDYAFLCHPPAIYAPGARIRFFNTFSLSWAVMINYVE